MSKNILITGAKGQLGSELQDLQTYYPQLNFFPTDVEELDLTDKVSIATFIDMHHINYVINCAAYTAVDKAEDEIELCYKINYKAVRNLAETAAGKAYIIHISTNYVFDGQTTTPYKELDLTNPQSIYGCSKNAGEKILIQLCPESIIIRTAWLYSSYGHNFVKTMLQLSRERTELHVVADQYGTPTYATDLAQTILSIIVSSEKTDHFPSGIYHYSNDGITTWFDFTKTILQMAGITSCTVYPLTTSQYSSKAQRPTYSVLDKSKIKMTFGLAIPQWDNSLLRYLKAIKQL